MFLVTGATGHVGGAALRRLLTDGHAVAAMVRDASKAREQLPTNTPIRLADYDERSSLERAFDGVAHLVFVASDGDAHDMMRHHANVIEVATARGVKRITFTSIVDLDERSPFCYAPVYRDAERRLVGCGVEWTILRCGLYSDLVLDHGLLPAQDSGEISLPIGSARIAPISRDDVAEALAAVSVSHSCGGKTFALTGPRSWSFDEIAALMTNIVCRPVRYSACSPAEYLKRAQREMDDSWWPHAFSTLCAAIHEGCYEAVSSDFERLVGRPAESFESLLRRTFRPNA